MKPEIGPFLLRLWRSYRPLLLIFATITTLRSAALDWNWVPTASMAPTIVPVEGVLVNKLAYGLRIPFTTQYLAHWSDPARGDVVVLFSPADEMRIVKRVVGIAGDTVEMREERLLINGVPVEYEPSPAGPGQRRLTGASATAVFAVENLAGRKHPIMLQPGVPALRSFGPTRVPPGHFFVLGDNRDNSNDSRFIGPIERRRIVGRAIAVIASADFDRYGLPRPDRFFTAIE